MIKHLRSNTITKMLDKFFNDKCLYTKSRSVQRGPGFLCQFYIFLILLSLIYNIIKSQEYVDDKNVLFTRRQVILQNVIDIFLSLFSIIFIYYMCYICRGFVGFVLLMIIMSLLSLIRYTIFKNYMDLDFYGTQIS